MKAIAAATMALVALCGCSPQAHQIKAYGKHYAHQVGSCIADAALGCAAQAFTVECEACKHPNRVGGPEP